MKCANCGNNSIRLSTFLLKPVASCRSCSELYRTNKEASIALRFVDFFLMMGCFLLIISFESWIPLLGYFVVGSIVVIEINKHVGVQRLSKEEASKLNSYHWGTLSILVGLPVLAIIWSIAQL
jgi:hypothetical protein